MLQRGHRRPPPPRDDAGTTPPFFIYTGPAFSDNYTRVCDDDWNADTQLMRLLRKHPARVASPENATLFVIPTPLYQSYVCDGVRHRAGHGPHAERVAAMLAALRASPWFARRGGADHLLPAHSWRFSGWAFNEVSSKRLLPRNDVAWRLLENVTLTRYEVFNLSRWGSAPLTPRRRPAALFAGCPDRDVERARANPAHVPACGWEMTRRSVVAPHSTPDAMGVTAAGPWARWAARNVSMFFHTRSGKGKGGTLAHGSHALRHAAASRPHCFPNGSVGFGVPRRAWAAGPASSRWCLAVRGDSPSTLKFWNALASGCIPVVVSDSLEEVGVPPFGVKLDEIAVKLDEAAFLQSPEAVMPMLEALPVATLKAKLAALRWAQPRLIMNHPASLVASLVLEQAWRQMLRDGVALPSRE